MRYVPNLIPEKSRVLRHYFIGKPLSSPYKSKVLSVIAWILGVTFLIVALVYISHPVLLFMFGVLGLILIPPGHQWMEKTFKLKLTNKIKSTVGIALFILSLPLSGYYKSVDDEEIRLQKLEAEIQAKKKAEEEKRNQIRIDSLNYYISASAKFAEVYDINHAQEQLAIANKYTTNQDEEGQIQQASIVVSSAEAKHLVKTGKFQAAIDKVNNLISQGSKNKDLYYLRAISYSKTGQTARAVSDCKASMELGNTDASQLHEKINPLKRRVSYYVTRCCDGSTSNAQGRGACSHHGGVCDWNEPVYETYRKY